MWRRLEYMWFRYFRRRKISRPGDKLDGSSASEPISCREIVEDERSVTFTWNDGFPVLKARKKYWVVLKNETPAQEPDSTYTARKFVPAKGGKTEWLQIGYRQVGNPSGNISAEIWTNVDDPLTWARYKAETKCKNPNS